MSGTIDVACPGCHTCYHLSAESGGQKFRCPNKLCNVVFDVPGPDRADGEIPMAAEFSSEEVPIAQATIVDAPQEPVEPVEPVDVVPAAAVVSEELSRGFGEEAPDVEGLASLPRATAVIPPPPPPRRFAADEPQEPQRRSRRPSRRERTRRTKLVALAALTVMAVAAGVLLWLNPPDWTPASDKNWNAITELVAQHKWPAALRKIEEFEAGYPSDPRIGQIPFFRDLCEAGPEIYSTTGDATGGLHRLESIFKNHRDNPAYAGYCVDLYQALAFLIDSRFLPEAQRLEDPQQLAQARQALELLKTVGQAIEEAWVKDRTAEIASGVDEAAQTLDRALARSRIKKHLEQLQSPNLQIDAEAHYAAIEREWTAQPSLRDDRELAAMLESAYAAEPGRVRYVPDDARSAAAEPPADLVSSGETLAVAWGRAAEPVPAAMAGAQDQVIVSLARGVLYAFDARGTLLWARRLGVDSHRLPARIGRSASASAALIAVSTEDNSLVALEATPEGRELWRYPVGHDIVAPLAVVPRRAGPNDPLQFCGMLPTAQGEVHVLELVRGRRLGRYVTRQPMTVGGTHDPGSGLALFPADAHRLYAFDPAAIDDRSKPACRSVLFTGHASGALRSPPVVVGQYLVLAECSGLERTSLRVFEVGPKGFGKVNAAPLKQVELRGWSWFAPHAAPDRITLVTDRGDLGLFGLNLDNVGEAIYPIVQDGPSGPTVRLDVEDNARTLAVGASEHLVWIMAGGRLQKFAVDVLNQKVRLLWPQRGEEPGASGIPVHESQADRSEQSFFLTTMAPSGRAYRMTAVDSESGKRRWQSQLGLQPLGDPIVWNGAVVLLDAAGQKLRLHPDELPAATDSRAQILQSPPRDPLPAGADESRMMRIGQPPEPVHWVVPVDQGAKLAVSTLRSPEADPSPWVVLSLPSRLHGRPCALGDDLIVPCADGQLRRLRWDGAASNEKNEVTYTWSRSQPPGPVGADIYPIGSQAVLVVDQRRRLRVLQSATQDLIRRWVEVGEPLEMAAPMQGEPLVAGDEILVFDSAGALLRLDARNPARQVRDPLAMGMKITAGPALRGNWIVAVAEERRVVAVPLEEPGGGKPAFWASEPLAGRIHGLPQLAGDVLLVADNAMQVSGLRLADGSPAWRVPLGVRVGPAAAPVPFGSDRMLVPLADGTLLLVPLAGTLAEAP